MSEIRTRPAHAIGEKLRAVRQRQQLSLRELADKAEMSASMLSQIETGKAYPSVRSIYNIAAALAVPVDYFFPDLGGASETAREPHLNPAGAMTASEMREATVNRAFDTAAEAIPAAPSVPVVHGDARPMIELRGGITWARLTALAEADAEFLEIAYAPGATSGVNMSHHAGREFGLILEGELIIELGFESHTLGKGDSIIFDSSTPHRLTNAAAHTMRALWVVLNQASA